jgi:hypothetical protein
LFGPDDHAVCYFRTTAEAVQQSKFLLVNAAARRRLSIRLRERLAAGKHTYADRLAAMLQLSGVYDSPSHGGGRHLSHIRGLQREGFQPC